MWLVRIMEANTHEYHELLKPIAILTATTWYRAVVQSGEYVWWNT